jgi:AP-3 complex subunit beta
MEVWNVTTGGISSGPNPLASAGDAHFFEDSIHPSTIRSYFIQSDPSNPSSTPKLTKGMKWLLASMSKGRDVSDFFPHVVKLTGASSLEVRKLVYMYLVHYADHDDTCRELALLSINSFQRGLADSEQLIRALALRALTSVRVAEIIQIQILGVQTCARDRSPYVRKCAANALSKLAPRCDPYQREILLELLQKLLDDDVSTMVLSSAIIAFSELCPQELHRLHGCYRKLCHLLTDVDEFGQVVMMEVLTRYCRQNFTNPGVGSAEGIDREKRLRRYGGAYAVRGGDKSKQQTNTTMKKQSPLPPKSHPRSIIQTTPLNSAKRLVSKAFYSDDEDESYDGDDAQSPLQPLYCPATTLPLDTNPLMATSNLLVDTRDPYKDEDDHLDEDHRLLLRSSIPLLKSRNSAVVLAVCSLHYYCGVSSIKVSTPLLTCLESTCTFCFSLESRTDL